jgi:hypothetical protein
VAYKECSSEKQEHGIHSGALEDEELRQKVQVKRTVTVNPTEPIYIDLIFSALAIICGSIIRPRPGAVGILVFPSVT